MVLHVDRRSSNNRVDASKGEIFNFFDHLACLSPHRRRQNWKELKSRWNIAVSMSLWEPLELCFFFFSENWWRRWNEFFIARRMKHLVLFLVEFFLLVTFEENFGVLYGFGFEGKVIYSFERVTTGFCFWRFSTSLPLRYLFFSSYFKFYDLARLPGFFIKIFHNHLTYV